MNLIKRVQDHPWRDASLEEKETSEVGVFVEGHPYGVNLETLVGAMHIESLKC